MLGMSVLSALTHAVSSVTGRSVPVLDAPATLGLYPCVL